MLRVIQDGTFQRLGSNETLKVDVRIIAATNRDLEAEVEKGTFRDDLFYRLNVIELHLPPLRNRTADILPLANAFINTYAHGKARLSPEVTAILATYPWPGNVRELQNAMERASLMARGGLILPEHLPRRIQEHRQSPSEQASHTRLEESPGLLQDLEDQVILQSLAKHSYNRTETAKALGISRRTLIYKLQRLKETGHTIHPTD